MFRKFALAAAFSLTLIPFAFAETPAAPALILRGPKDNIRAAALSLDGKRLLATSDDKKLTTWELATGKQLSQFDIPAGSFAVAETADAKHLAIAGGRGPAQILDAATGKLVKELAKSTNAAAISHDGKILVTEVLGDPAFNLTIFSLPDGKTLQGIKLKGGQPTSLSLSKDGQLLAVGLFSGSAENIQIIDTKTGQTKSKLRHTTGMVEVYLADDGATLASRNVTPDKESIWLWNLKTATSKPVPNTKESGQAGAFSPDGKLFLAAAGRGVLKTEVPTAKNDGRIATTKDAAGPNILCFTPDSKQLLRSQYNTIELWDTPK